MKGDKHGGDGRLVKGRHFEATLILQAVSWYLRYPLSYRDIEELFLERGLEVSHSTLNRWVLAYAPQTLLAHLQQFGLRPVEVYVWIYMPCASLRKSCFLEPLGKFNRNHPTFPRSKARWRASEEE